MAVSTRPVPPIAQRWMDAWNAKDPQAMRALFTPDGVYEDLAFQTAFAGGQGVADWVRMTADHIPDLRGEITDAFQADDRVAVRWRFSGTPVLLGTIQGTGESLDVPVVSVIELREGRIERVTDCYNLANLLRQLGLPSGPYVPRNP